MPTTLEEHRPKAHQRHLQWTPRSEGILSIGKFLSELHRARKGVSRILQNRSATRFNNSWTDPFRDSRFTTPPTEAQIPPDGNLIGVPEPFWHLCPRQCHLPVREMNLLHRLRFSLPNRSRIKRKLDRQS